MSDNGLAGTIVEVAKERNSDVYLFAGEISRQTSDDFIKCCPDEAKPHAILLLASFGGDAAAAFRLTRYLQERYKKDGRYLFLSCAKVLALSSHWVQAS